ncbi:MAG: glucose-6-phosphate isomerase [Pseudomonadales bacterium]|nr:glucose-6-phosphate isomerase [Pseudomonadales bacterium]
MSITKFDREGREGLNIQQEPQLGREQVLARLQALRQSMQIFSLGQALNAERIRSFSRRLGPLYFDYTRHLVTAEVMDSLQLWGKLQGWRLALQKLSAGYPLNASEDRPAHHMALRDLGSITADATARFTAQADRERMLSLLDRIKEGKLRGARGHAFDTLVNIGVGGSDLGAAMAVQALRAQGEGRFSLHFISSIDGVALTRLLPQLRLDSTLFIISSKSFSTPDTFENVKTVQTHLQDQGYTPDECSRHFLGISAVPQAMFAFGIPEDLQLPFMNSIGGRFSLASCIGLPLAAHLGRQGFMAFLQGMHEMDRHVLEEVETSIPATMALLEWWYAQFWQAEALAILPYHQDMERFPAYATQLQMESLGKSCDIQGRPLLCSGHVVFGEVGSNAQHSFMQLLHQGTRMIPADILLFANMPETNDRQRNMTLAQGLAQGRALAMGYDESAAAHDFPGDSFAIRQARLHPGNRPSSTLLWESLEPQTLGMLVALYEHKTFLLAQLWGINPFDQMGVELGKRLARPLVTCLNGETTIERMDAGTAVLLQIVDNMHRGKYS